MKGKSCLTNLMFFYYKVTYLLYKGKAADVGFFNLEKLLILSVVVSFWTKCPSYR